MKLTIKQKAALFDILQMFFNGDLAKAINDLAEETLALKQLGDE